MGSLGLHDLMLLIGSHALRFWKVDPGRASADFDLIGTFQEIQDFLIERKPSVVEAYPLGEKKYFARMKGNLIYEFEIAWPGSAAEEIMNRRPEARVYIPWGKDTGARVADLDELLTLKLSHRYLKNSPHFLKTMRDIRLLRSKGAEVFDHDWLKRREKETYVYKHPKLDVMKKDFFKGDGVEYVYDHDDIHRVVAVMPQPAYEYYKPEGSEVMCSRDMFFAASEFVRLRGVLEEAYTLALERSQIPFGNKKTPRQSFEMALMKVCTSITSGWFREYAWENYDRVVAMYDDRYVEKFWNAVAEGRVRKVEEAR